MSDCTSPATACHRREPRTLCRCALGSYDWHVASLPCLMPAEVWHHGRWEAAWGIAASKAKKRLHHELLLKTPCMTLALDYGAFYENVRAVYDCNNPHYVLLAPCQPKIVKHPGTWTPRDIYAGTWGVRGKQSCSGFYSIVAEIGRNIAHKFGDASFPYKRKF